MDVTTFKAIAKKRVPKKKLAFSLSMAFFAGGGLGLLSQFILDSLVNYASLSTTTAMIYNAMIFMSLAIILTLFGVYNNLGQIFGAGLFIPITGFANSVCSAALEYKFEGPIFGLGGKIFSLAGSVIIYGILGSFFYSLTRFVLSFIGISL